MRAALVLLSLLASHSAAHAAAPDRPNIVLIMPDDVGYGDFAFTGNPVIHTPALDGLAAQSIRFTNFHVSPTCSPTRSALMTGRHEFKNGVTHTIQERERLTLKATTLAQFLKSAGYATGIFGKWHLGDEPERWPDKRGFDEMFIHGTGGIGQTFKDMTSGDVPGNSYFDPIVLHNGKFEKTFGYCTDVFFSQARKWIAAAKDGGPFFAYITPNAAHAPLDVPDGYYRKYADKVPEPVARFYGMIENIDDNVGRLLAQLKTSGLEQNTLVIFMTDNGSATGWKLYNAGMRAGKGTPYEGGTRVPGLWRWPAGFAGGADCPALTAHIDIFPTLAEIIGVELSGPLREQVEGRSLVPLLKNPQAAWPDRTLVTHVGRWKPGEAEQSKYSACSIRDARFALVDNRELYDLAADPGQKMNVIADHPAEVAKLRAAYDAWWASVLPLLENENANTSRTSPFAELYRKQTAGQ